MEKRELAELLKPIIDVYIFERDINYGQIEIEIFVHAGAVTYISVSDNEKIKYKIS